ncbi:hypothetical protein ACFE04_031124 [Oxalis oulophora]
MEDKQLDFNQPFLSVRRQTPTAASSEPQGKQKTDNALPKIPPRPPVYKSELKSGPIRNPGTVPFIWEKSPGRPKDESKSKALTFKRPPIAPKLPPGRILKDTHRPSDENPESSKGSLPETEKFPSSSQNDEKDEAGSYISEDCDENYVDALDTLSRTESFFYNCSVSGVSEMESDGPELKPSGIFSSDPQTRDLMMGRFLPAAKAMASETTPQYTTKKPILAQEQVRPVQKLATPNKFYQRTSYNGPYHPPDETLDESEDEYDDYGGSSIKACGLISRLCMKSSLCLLNPVPGVRMQAHLVRRTKAKSSYPSSSSKTDNEHAKDIAYEKSSRLGSMDQHIDKMELKNESRSIAEKPFNNQSDLREDEQSLGSPDNRINSVVNGHSPHREGTYIFRDLLASDSPRCESASSSPVVEKTLYIDSMHPIKSRSSDSSSSDMKGLIHYEEADSIEEPVKGGEFLVKNVDDSNLVDEGAKLLYKSSESIDFAFRGSSDRSINDILIKIQDELTNSKMAADGKFDSEKLKSMQSGDHGKIQESLALSDSSKVINDWKIGAESQLLSTYEPSNSLNHSYSPLAPPLPRSPSDSWLKRALPSSRSSRLSHGVRHCSTVQASDASFNLQHGHLKFSELHQELLTPIPEI